LLAGIPVRSRHPRNAASSMTTILASIPAIARPM
jgi:hypothetical protein